MKKYSLYTLVLVLLGVIIIITSLFIYLLITVQKEKLIREEIETKTHLTKTINEILYSPAWIYRIGMLPGLAKIFIGEAAKFKNVIYIRIVSTDGLILHSVIEGEWGKKIKDPDLLALLPTETVITRDEVFREEKIKSVIYPGYGDRVIMVGFSLEEVEKAIKDMIIFHTLIGFSSLALVILIIFLFLKRNILSPLKRIITTCEEVRRGNLETKADVKSKTEIGELATTFNEMIRDLRESHAALEESKKVLEIKVEARTKELKELAEGLDGQVQEKTKELQGKLEELEKFHRLAVGRELKMIELKEEIKKLKEELEKSKGRQ